MCCLQVRHCTHGQIYCYLTMHSLSTTTRYTFCPLQVVCLQHTTPDQPGVVGESVYTVADRSKRRKTADKKAAAAKAAEEAAAVDPSEPWAIHHRQPWADKEVKPAELNDEQKAFLEQASHVIQGPGCLAVSTVIHMLLQQPDLSPLGDTWCCMECCLATSHGPEWFCLLQTVATSCLVLLVVFCRPAPSCCHSNILATSNNCIQHLHPSCFACKAD